MMPRDQPPGAAPKAAGPISANFAKAAARRIDPSQRVSAKKGLVYWPLGEPHRNIAGFRGTFVDHKEGRMTDLPQKLRRQMRNKARLVDLHGKVPGDALTQFFLEERARRSFGVTGYLVSGGGAGAISCWFEIGGLYANKAPELVLQLLLAASALFLCAVVVGFFAALAGYKAFDTAISLPIEDFSAYNRADQWFAITTAARIVAAVLITIGGLTAFAAYLKLGWH
jgi:hypothetical protein